MLYYVIMAQIGIGWLFIRYLVQQDRGPKEPKRTLFFAGLLGFMALIVAGVAESFLISDSLYDGLALMSSQDILRTMLVVGAVEEVSKSFILALFLYRKRYFNEMTDGVIYFALAGMVFGVGESILYATTLGAGTGLMRIIVAPFIHAAFCAIFGWTLALRKVRGWPWLIVFVGAALSVGLHALYNFGLLYGAWWSVLTALGLAVLLNVGVFKLLHYGQRLDAESGIATKGVNYYCRQCGRPNPERFLYCTMCGRRT